LLDPLGYLQGDRIAPGARPEGDPEDPVAGSGLIERRGGSQERPTGASVPDFVRQEARLDLLALEPEFGRRAGRALPVGVIDDGVVVIFGCSPQLVHQGLGGGHDVFSERLLGLEAGRVFGVVRVVALPVVGRVRHVGVGPLDRRDGVLVGRAEDERRSARRRGVLGVVAGFPVGGVGADGQRVRAHAGADHPDRRLHGLGPGLAGELDVARLEIRVRPERVGDDRGRRLDVVGMALAARPDPSQVGGVDRRPLEGVARGLDGDGDDVLVRSGDGFPVDRCRKPVPDPVDLLVREPVLRHVRAVAVDPDRRVGFE